MKNEDKYQVDESREISLRLEQYDDIFSDFDMRTYSRRALSSDFIDEIRRASYDKFSDGVELNLCVPASERNEEKETVIAERLKAHFQKHFIIQKKEKRRVFSRGMLMVVLGVISMILASRIVYEDPTNNAWLSFLVVFLEPAAWFLLWEGMDQIMFTTKDLQPELDFYRKMSGPHARIDFKSYDVDPGVN